MIEIICWVFELGRINIAYEVSVLSLYLVQHQNGHLVQVLHIFKYLDIHKDINLAFNPAISEFSDPLTVNIKIKHMKKMYPDAVKNFPPSAPAR